MASLVCDRCEDRFPDLLPTTMGQLCESCAWAVIEQGQDGELGLLEQATELDTTQTHTQQAQL